MIDEPPELWRHWYQLGAIPPIAPKRWMDAYLAAFAIASSIPLISLDTDFQQFERRTFAPIRFRLMTLEMIKRDFSTLLDRQAERSGLTGEVVSELGDPALKSSNRVKSFDSDCLSRSAC